VQDATPTRQGHCRRVRVGDFGAAARTYRAAANINNNNNILNTQNITFVLTFSLAITKCVYLLNKKYKMFYKTGKNK